MMRFLVLFCISVSVLLRLSATAAYVLGNHTDRLALLALKDQMTSYPSWSDMSGSWNDSNHFCDWGGVTCSRWHQRVVMLNLRSQGLTGSISPYIGNLSFLRNITLANNSLHGQIPQEIGRLFRLRVLGIHNNSLSGPIPVNLSHCANLDTLTLDFNSLTGKIPEELGSCTKLQILMLKRNGLTGRIPVSFGNLTSLYFLDLIENNLDGSIPSSLTQLKRLETLRLSANSLSGKVPPLLYNISSLKQIFLTKNQLEGRLPPDIGLNLPLLTDFSVASNNFTGPIPVSLFSNSTNIQFLDLGENNFTGKVPVEIGGLKVLNFLRLPNNFLGSGGESGNDLDFVTSLNNCSNLQRISIFHNQFGGSLPASIANLSAQLLHLFIGYNPITGSIPSEIDNLRNLITFSAPSTFLTGTIPKRIGMMPNLQFLALSANRLSGQIPYSMGNMTSLYYMDLSDNRLSGTIVPNFENCQNLQAVSLKGNNLTGIIPPTILGLLNLFQIDLSRNHFYGSLPLEVGRLNNLNYLAVSENNIGGEIPSTLGTCVVLEYLYLEGNLLQGIIPSSFSFLKGIQVIDLSQNNLSGKIPKVLQDFVYLESLNLSFNNFDGEVPTRGVFWNASRFSISGNSKLCGGITEVHLPSCFINKSKHIGLPLVVKLILGLVLPSIIITSLILVLNSRNKSTTKIFSKKLLQGSLQRVSYNELRDATNGFSSENLIGVGSFGSVYKGVLAKSQILIAVKVFNLNVRGASKSFMAECKILRRVRHRNLLKILTVCSSIDTRGNDFKALICQFMSNGSLESWLHPSADSSQRPSKFLNLFQRLKIAIDIASALDYLHNYSPAPIIHCDLKPSNVLLDDDMVAYVCDFGLAKFLHKSINSNSDKSQTNSIGVRGTIGYIPPEYGMGGELATEGDVYSYGIMLMEMFTGKRPTDEMFKDNLSLRSFCESNTTDQTDRLMEIIDMHLLEETTNEFATDEIQEQTGMTNAMKECLISVLEVGVMSSSESASDRMGIKEVLSKMHKIRDAFVCN